MPPPSGRRAWPGARWRRTSRRPAPAPDRRDRVRDSATRAGTRSEEHTSELQSLMRISYAVFCLKKKIKNTSTLVSRFHIINQTTHEQQQQKQAVLTHKHTSIR